VGPLHRDNGVLGQDNGSWDGGGYLLGALTTQTDLTSIVLNDYRCIRPGPLTSLSLLLH
jgi:hypothetical protein